jgi:hypothetical protein
MPSFAKTAAALKPVTKSVGSINVSVDPRIELLMVVQSLGSYRDKMFTSTLTKFDYQYTRDVEKYFAPYKTHRAVTLFDQMWQKGFWLGAPVEAMIYCSMPPDIRLSPSVSDFVKTRAGGEQNVRDFVAALAEFARDSHFAEFYRAHQEAYERAVDTTAANLQKNDLLGVLESYYGMKQGSYTIVTAMLGHYGGFGPRIERSPGIYEIFSIGGPSKLKDNEPVFFGESEGLRSIVWHEFSHPFINPMTERHPELVAQYSAAIYSKILNPTGQKKIEDAADRQMAVEENINEHMIRAINIRLVDRNISHASALEKTASEKKKGYLYIDALCAKLEQYEKQREKYPTMESFYPELIKAFGTELPAVN